MSDLNIDENKLQNNERFEKESSWINQHAKNIIDAMYFNQSSYFENSHDEGFDPTKREFSEMQLCNSWQRIEAYADGLPEGYKIVEGNVSGIQHIYLQNDNDFIMCIAPAQFLEVPIDGSRGSRRKLLQAKVKDSDLGLIEIDSINGIFILVGSRDQIKDKLGLDYAYNKDTETLPEFLRIKLRKMHENDK